MPSREPRRAAFPKKAGYTDQGISAATTTIEFSIVATPPVYQKCRIRESQPCCVCCSDGARDGVTEEPFAYDILFNFDPDRSLGHRRERWRQFNTSMRVFALSLLCTIAAFVYHRAYLLIVKSGVRTSLHEFLVRHFGVRSPGTRRDVTTHPIEI